MGFLIDFVRQMRSWERPVKVGLAAGLVGLLLLVNAAATAPEPLRNGLWFSAALLFVVMQGVMMWGNRNMVAPYTLAQRQALAGDFAAAEATLLAFMAECDRQRKRPPVEALVLLGNVRRSLGRLAESESVLRQALQRRPGYHFPLYGLGRTLLVQGQYAAAAPLIEQALHAGAPAAVAFDLGHALHRLGEARAADLLRQVLAAPATEPHRRLLAQHWLHHRGEAPAPPPDLVAAGLDFWQAEITRFAATPYGQALKDDVAALAHAGASQEI
ncbi:MAG: hypothetical protein MUE40_03915 [Anaerolineae bacterium]|jgi:tetratricopeptide (TPR) repeat protein|nr:hypothetical protein [Anaerolineae bacterium]